MMEILVDAGADVDIRVKALLWVESMNWEMIVYDVTPLSYAQCGFYRQFHRREEQIYSNIEYLYRKRYKKARRYGTYPTSTSWSDTNSRSEERRVGKEC